MDGKNKNLSNAHGTETTTTSQGINMKYMLLSEKLPVGAKHCKTVSVRAEILWY